MQRKTLAFLVAGFVSLVLIFVLSLNVMAAYDSQVDSQAAIQTDKSDRTLLKEIIINQRKTHALLREMKASLAK